MRCLITDDSKLARKVLKTSLSKYIDEENIYEANDGLAALKLLLQEKFDIVFLDLTMPVMNGYEAIPKLLDIQPDIKIVVVSADVQQKAKERVLALGASVHMEKPIKDLRIKEILEAL